jgi:hypothetical protein
MKQNARATLNKFANPMPIQTLSREGTASFLFLKNRSEKHFRKAATSIQVVTNTAAK